jgi:hypothetical protein
MRRDGKRRGAGRMASQRRGETKIVRISKAAAKRARPAAAKAGTSTLDPLKR